MVSWHSSSAAADASSTASTVLEKDRSWALSASAATSEVGVEENDMHRMALLRLMKLVFEEKLAQLSTLRSDCFEPAR